MSIQLNAQISVSIPDITLCYNIEFYDDWYFDGCNSPCMLTDIKKNSIIIDK